MARRGGGRAGELEDGVRAGAAAGPGLSRMVPAPRARRLLPEDAAGAGGILGAGAPRAHPQQDQNWLALGLRISLPGGRLLGRSLRRALWVLVLDGKRDV